MRKLFLIAFSPLIIASIFLMAYYGIVSNDLGEKVFAVLALTAFIFWLKYPFVLGDTLFEDEDLAQSKKNPSMKGAVIFLILVLSGTSFIVFSHSVSNFVEKVERKESPISIYVTKTYKENSVDFTYKMYNGKKEFHLSIGVDESIVPFVNDKTDKVIVELEE